MIDSNLVDLVSKKKKLLIAALTLIAENKGYKYSTSYTHLLYLLDIIIIINKNTIFLRYEHLKHFKILKYFPNPNNLLLLSRYITSWYQKFKPNKVNLMYFLHECLFPLKVFTFGKNIVIILHKFSSLFKSYRLKRLLKENKRIKFPIIKHDHKKKKLKTLQIPAKENLKSRSDFVFVVTTSLLRANIIESLKIGYNVPGSSNNSPICEVAIVAEVKTHWLPTLFAVIRN